MQDRIYRFAVKRSVVSAVFAAHDTVTGKDVTIYEWTPPAEERQQARETLTRLAEGLEAEVFSLDASLYLVVASVEQARRVLPALRREGLFPGHWPGEEPVRQGPPSPPPRPIQGAEPAAGNSGQRAPMPAYTPVREPPGPAKVAATRRRSVLKEALLLLLIAAVGFVVYAMNQSGPARPAVSLVRPRLTVEPGQAHPGERVSVNWSSAGYDRVQIDGQRVDNAGNRMVVAAGTRTFRLVAVAADGQTATAEARLIVTPARIRATKPSAGEPLNDPSAPQP